MLKKLTKRLISGKREAQLETDAKIAALEKEVAELKALLGVQEQKTSAGSTKNENAQADSCFRGGTTSAQKEEPAAKAAYFDMVEYFCNGHDDIAVDVIQYDHSGKKIARETFSWDSGCGEVTSEGIWRKANEFARRLKHEGIPLRKEVRFDGDTAKQCCPEEEFALTNASFHNRVLMGTWRGKADYIPQNGKIQNGEIVLEVDRCQFYIPSDRRNPYLEIRILHGMNPPIRFDQEILVISSQKGMVNFSVQKEDRAALQSWLEKRLPELEKVRTFPNVFLDLADKGNDFPHPFLSKHTVEGIEIRKYFAKQFPVFGKQLPWYGGSVDFLIDEKQTQMNIEPHLSSEAWSWTETEDQLRIALTIQEVGFFDDSESEFRFEYSMLYLGDTLQDHKFVPVNNSKLYQPLPLTKWSNPGEETYIAENPFGMRGFYKIAWRTSKR